jgi:hypothetical protein
MQIEDLEMGPMGQARFFFFHLHPLSCLGVARGRSALSFDGCGTAHQYVQQRWIECRGVAYWLKCSRG